MEQTRKPPKSAGGEEARLTGADGAAGAGMGRSAAAFAPVASEEGRAGRVAGDGPASAGAVRLEEERHLAATLAQLGAALAQAEGLARAVAGGYDETASALMAARGELAPEEAAHGSLELDRMGRQAALAEESRERLAKLLDAPYFARVDFAAADAADDEPPMTAYLGRFAFSWESRSVVSDWRSPVAGLFYDYEPGPAAFEAPGGRREGALVLKRQIAVEDGRIAWAVDTGSSVRDEVLARALSQGGDTRMHDIVASIQREQNAVIRDEEPGTLVIQGVAGSGKTSIALHRIAYLLYRQKERLSSRSVAIVSPSRVFADYISGVLPELGEEPVGQWSLHGLASLLLEGVARVEAPRSWADEADPARVARAAAKGTRAFADDLVAWLSAATAPDAPEPLLDPRDLTVGTAVVEGGWLAARFSGYGALPLVERLDLLAGDALSQAVAASFGRARQGLPTRREVRGRLLRMMRVRDAMALYRRFLAETGRSALLRVPARGMVEWEDAFPLALCRLAFDGPGAFPALAAVRHVVIDEMQDLTPVQHAALARLLPGDKTLLGDVSQLVDGRVSVTPEDVAAAYPGARLVRLMRSYRSTWEITELAARVRPVEGLCAVERHGPAPRLVRCGDTRGALAAVDEAVGTWRAAGGRTLGVIAKSDLLAARYAEVLAARHEVALVTDETEEFPAGIAVCSVRMAKGLEFDDVVLLDADARQYATEADRCLLYVGITRAMHRLTVVYRDEPSPFLL